MAEWKLDEIETAGFCNVSRRTCRRHYQWDRVSLVVPLMSRMIVAYCRWRKR
jgi:hypothetical protein